MSAINNPTNSAAVTEIIESEQVQGSLMAEAHRPPLVGEALLTMLDVSSQPTATVALPQWTSDSVEGSASSGKTETDEFSYVEQDTTEKTITVATVGIRKGLSYEAISDTVLDLVAGAVGNSFLDMAQQLEVDGFATITSATTTQDHSGTALTVQHIIDALAARAANNPHAGMLCGLFHSRQIGHLRTSLKDNKQEFATATAGAGGGDLFDYARVEGYVGRWMGIQFFESNNVPQFDSNNWSGAIFNKSAIAVAVKEPRTGWIKEFPERSLRDVGVRARYGTVLRFPANLVEVVTKKAA